MTAGKIKRTLGTLGERGFLKIILPKVRRAPHSFIVPPGDDAAVLRNGGRSVLSIDGITDRTHFKSSWARRCEVIGGFSLGRGLGWKLMGASLSDLAAMGKTKNRWAMIYLGAPGSTEVSFLQDLQRGVNESAAQYECALAGGDTVKADSLSLVAAVGADLDGKSALTRSGATVGDLICVTGTVGDASVGLRVLEKNVLQISRNDARYFVRRFFQHEPLFKQSAILADEPAVTSLIDLSDAVKDTVEIVCASSKVGAALNVDQIPVSPAYMRSFPVDARLLTGGEDYALFFTLRPAALARLRRKLSFAVIGWTKPASKGITYLMNGKPIRAPKAFAHFS